MTTNLATLTLICELVGVWLLGTAVVLALAVAAVERLNGRVAELEARLEVLSRSSPPVQGGVRLDSADFAPILELPTPCSAVLRR